MKPCVLFPVVFALIFTLLSEAKELEAPADIEQIIAKGNKATGAPDHNSLAYKIFDSLRNHSGSEKSATYDKLLLSQYDLHLGRKVFVLRHGEPKYTWTIHNYVLCNGDAACKNPERGFLIYDNEFTLCHKPPGTGNRVEFVPGSKVSSPECRWKAEFHAPHSLKFLATATEGTPICFVSCVPNNSDVEFDFVEFNKCMHDLSTRETGGFGAAGVRACYVGTLWEILQN